MSKMLPMDDLLTDCWLLTDGLFLGIGGLCEVMEVALGGAGTERIGGLARAGLVSAEAASPPTSVLIGGAEGIVLLGGD